MASADDAHSRPKRPAAMARQSSSQSHLSQSPVEGHGKPAHHKAQRHHVVGQRERVQRNASVGKNLNKLNKAAQQAQAQAQAQAADSTTRHHRRSHSGASLSAPSSPRPSFKRNASSGTMRKNHSSGHLAHKSYTKHAVKSAKGEIALAKRSSRSRPTSPERPVAVHFAMAGDDDDDDDDEAGDDGWTEESASQSPTTTRSNTRSNSVVLEAQHRLAERNMENNRGAPVQPPRSEDAPAQAPPLTLTDRTRNNTHTNGGRVQPPPLPHQQQQHQQHSRPADADIITSRLLQRSASHHTPAQTSTVAATVVPTAHRRHLLGGSAGSTLVDTPGRDLVSRFMDGDGSAGTPHDGVYMPSPNDEAGDEGNLNGSKRNQSMPNVSGADRSSKTPSRSGATTPTNLPPSRTQQKLMLQRASSVLEPQKLVPVTLPRTGGPTFLQSGLHYNANGEGRVDPRLQQQFNHVTVEYKVVRRYRNPLGDSIARIQHTPGLSRKTRLLPVSASAITTSTTSSSFVYARSNPASPNASFHHAGGNDGDGDDDDDDDNANIDTAAAAAGVETNGASALRGSHSHASFEGQGRHVRGGGVGSTSSHGIIDEGDGAPARQSFESSDPVLRALPSRDVAEEICRRLWESAEMVEAD